MKSLLRIAIMAAYILAAISQDDGETTTESFFGGDDFFSELDFMETATLNSSTGIPDTTGAVTEATTLGTPGSSTSATVINDNGEPVANYTPEIGYRMADKLSDQVRLFLRHFQQKDPIGIPGAVLPDPMPLPDLTKSMSLLGTVSFKNIRLYELSQFRLTHINTDLEKMQVYVELEMRRLISLGNYTMKTLLSRGTKGPFNITMLGVVAEGAVALERDPNGQLEATDSRMDMTCRQIIIDLQGSGMSTLTDGLGPLMFQSIKPVLLRKINTDIRADINKQIKKFTAKIPMNVSPLDLGIYEARRYVRNNHYDPYQLKNYTYNKMKMAQVHISDLWLEGLSNFNRVGDLSLSMDHGIIQFGVHVMTSKLKGHFKWALTYVGKKKNVYNQGMLTFDVDYLQVKILVNQSVNINHKPVIDDIDVRLGKLRIKHDGLNALDLFIESIVNVYMPDILKNIIVDSLEDPIKWKVQEILDHTLVDKYSIDNILNEKVLPKLDEFVTTYNGNKTYANVSYDTTPATLTALTAPINLSSLHEATTENIPTLSLNEIVTNSRDALVESSRSLGEKAAEVKNQTEALVSEKLSPAAQAIVAA